MRLTEAQEKLYPWIKDNYDVYDAGSKEQSPFELDKRSMGIYWMYSAGLNAWLVKR